MTTSRHAVPASDPLHTLGVGVGLRRALAAELLARKPVEIDWVEIHPENYVGRGGPFREHLEGALDHWRVLPHGLTTCFGNDDAPDERAWLGALRAATPAAESTPPPVVPPKIVEAFRAARGSGDGEA